ncbi:MAG: hypothetical protein QOJ19_3387 [Acidimicrobiia bacterium]|jgi:hypothetical protein|nr:hypothetical protein [Acidimicrobiia bacterium]
MPSSPLIPPLTSISSTLEDLIDRLTAMGDSERAAKHEDTSAALEEIERYLRSGARRLNRLLQDLERR